MKVCTSIALADTALDFDENLANIFNKVGYLAKVVPTSQACPNFLLEYTRVFSGQSREGRHPYAPWILINNPSSQEEEGLPLHRAPLQL